MMLLFDSVATLVLSVQALDEDSYVEEFVKSDPPPTMFDFRRKIEAHNMSRKAIEAKIPKQIWFVSILVCCIHLHLLALVSSRTSHIRLDSRARARVRVRNATQVGLLPGQV